MLESDYQVSMRCHPLVCLRLKNSSPQRSILSSYLAITGSSSVPNMSKIYDGIHDTTYVVATQLMLIAPSTDCSHDVFQEMLLRDDPK